MRLDRLNIMEEYILEKCTVTLDELTKQFQVSTNTIRRDLNELSKRGTIKKTYGGASANQMTSLPSVDARYNNHQNEKKKIGMLAADFIEDGETVFLDSGSTALHVIPHLAQKKEITIVTHSLRVMCEAAKYPTLRIIALGGLYTQETASFIGVTTLEALNHIKINAVFIAAVGVSLERGLTSTIFFEAELKRKVLESNNKVILVADQSKFDCSSTISFFDFNKLYAVVTDSKPSSEYLEAMKNSNIILCYK